jgi:DNA invertase Pin-like site-specific DNA recombinase
MKAIILARVSTEEQKEAGNSLPAQIKRLEDYCQRKGFAIAKHFSFDESAYKTKRDEFDGIMEYVKAQKEKIAVCFDKVDRFSRNVFDTRVAKLYDLAMLDKIELHFASDNLVISPEISATEKFHFGMNLGLAKYYSDAISDNVKRAYEAKIRKGEWIGKAPIGYINFIDGKGNKDIMPDPIRSHLITKMFELYATGNYSVLKIKQEMDKLGLKGNSKLLKPLQKSIIHHTLKNPFYYGEMRHKGNLYPHKYQPLTSRQTFDAAQAVMAGYHRKPSKFASKPFSLRGMIKCTCGCTITPEAHKTHNYYSCTNHKRVHAGRDYIREEDLLAPLYEVIAKFSQLTQEKIDAITAEMKTNHESKNRFHSKAIQTMRNEYDAIEIKISNLLDLRIDASGSITEEMFNQKLKALKERQSQLNDDLKTYTQADEAYYLTANRVMSVAKRAADILARSEPEGKRQFLNLLFQNLVLDGKKLDFELKTPFDAVLQVASSTSGLRR